MVGLADLGGNAVALAAGPLAGFGLAFRLTPRPNVPVVADVREWWAGATPAARILTGAALGALAAWAAWLARYPGLGFDSVTYHLPEVVSWLQQGSAGTVERIFPGVPIGNYPLTNEVLMSWAMGISGSFAPVALWAPAFVLLLAAAARLGLSRLGVPAPAAMLAIALLCFTPVLTHFQMNGAHTDLPGLAWLVCCAALCAGSLRRPRLLPFAVLAAGLAVGTKTTTAAVTGVVLVSTLVALRPELRRLRRPLVLAAVGAFLAGGLWYLRNLIEHGSPIWPQGALPWGDPAPGAFARSTRFIETPRAAIDRLGDEYLELIGSTLLVLAAALVAPLVARRREVTAATGVSALSVLLWSISPATGVARHDPATVATTRYLLPALAAATLALALTAKREGAARWFALATLSAGAALAAVQTFRLGFPEVPSPSTPLAGAAVGALAFAAASRLLRPRPAPGWAGAAATALAALVAAGLLSATASGFVERHARVGLFDGGLLDFFAEGPPAADSAPVAMGPIMTGLIAGDDLERELALLPPRAPCPRLVRDTRGEWVAVLKSPFRVLGPSAARGCFVADRPMFHDGWLVYRR
jgi:hypothetical protein